MDSLMGTEPCRLCAIYYSQETPFINLFHSTNDLENELKFIIKQLKEWNLLFSEEDGLPQSVCLNCFASFCNIDTFRKECEKAQEKLKDILLQKQTSQLCEESPTEEQTQNKLQIRTKQNVTLKNDDIEEVIASSIIPTSMNAVAKNFSENQSENLDDILVSNSDLNEDEIINSRISGNPLACQYCYCPATGSIKHLIYENSDALSQHFFDVHDPKLPYICPVCPQTYKSSKTRDNHVRQYHMLTVYSECKYCNEKIVGTMQAHQLKCNFIGNWQCEFCGKNYINVTLGSFQLHTQKHSTSQNYRCTVCCKVFKRRRNWETHLKSHQELKTTLSSKKKYEYGTHNDKFRCKCALCNKGFINISFLSKHIENFHSKGQYSKKPLAICTNCGLEFISINKLRNHIRIAKDENGKCRKLRFSSKDVQQNGKRAYNRKLHLAIRINSCDKRSNSQNISQPNFHHDTTNELYNENPSYVCQICKMVFTLERDLQDHTLIHTDPDDRSMVSCHLCGNLLDKLQMLEHLRDYHEYALISNATNGLDNNLESTPLEEIHKTNITPTNTASTFPIAKLLNDKPHLSLNDQNINIDGLLNATTIQNPHGNIEEQIEDYFFGSILYDDNDVKITAN